MLAYVIRRLIQAIPVVLITTFVVFVVLRLIPGDTAQVLAGGDASPEQVSAIRTDLGLDKPILYQYGLWISHVVTGDLGRSYILGRPVVGLIASAAPATVQLSLAGILIALLLGVPAGVAAGLRPNSPGDAVLAVASGLALGIPVFVMAIAYLLIFSLLLGWLPPGGRVDPVADPVAGLRSLILPALTLGLPTAAIFARFVRTAFIGVASRDYIRTAHSKGLSPRTVTLRHALRNALLPLVTIMGVQFGRLLGGTVIIEQVFGWPGMGRLALQAIMNRDYILFQAIVLLLVLGAVVINLVTDLSYGFLDPRIRDQG